MNDNQPKFIVEGGHRLSGTVKVSGSKNAALPILCASLLSRKKSTIKNVPEIDDIRNLLKIFTHLGVKAEFKDHIIEIDPSGFKNREIPHDLVCTMRASILLLGPLLAVHDAVKLSYPGGCLLGKRPVMAHTYALEKLGAEVMDDSNFLDIKIKKRKPATIIMPEISVTGTENALMLAALTPGKTEIRLAAAEPHVQDLCGFLNSMGAKISGIGTHFLTIEGVKELKGTEYSITGDYLEAGTMAIASLVTKGEITVTGIDTNQLDSLWQKLDEAGAKYELAPKAVKIFPAQKLNAISNLRTAVYPSFPTDLQAPFAVLLTQAHGQSKIFETLFDGRLNYLFELEKMGAKVQVLNPHQAIVNGPCNLKGVAVSSLDLRAGAAMILAALCAKGTTEISNINYINRGYERMEEKLRSLGAKITRVNPA